MIDLIGFLRRHQHVIPALWALVALGVIFVGCSLYLAVSW